VIHLVVPGTASYTAAVHAEQDNTAAVTATLKFSRDGRSLGTVTHQLSPGDLWKGIVLDLSRASPAPTAGTVQPSFAGCSSVGACTVDSDCPSFQYCTEVVFPGLPQQCANGCRSDAGCPSGHCAGDHSCQPTVAAWGDACTSNSECRVGLFCGMLSHLCQERCSAAGACGTDPTCCPVSNAPFCKQASFTFICSTTP
jgi:hypothetical protein